MAGLLHDTFVAARRLLATPVFLAFAVGSLAIGIGVTTAVYSAVHTFFWAPLGVPHVEALFAVMDGGTPARLSWLDYTDLKTQQASFAQLAATAPFSAAFIGGQEPEIAHGEAVAGEYFDMVAAAPRLGRLLHASDDRAAARVVVLSDQFWQTRLQRDRSVIGRTVKIAGVSYEVVGVVRGGFHGLLPFQPTAFWIPVHAMPRRGETAPGVGAMDDRGARQFSVWGRVAAAATSGRADHEVNTIGARLESAFPRAPRPARRWTVKPAASVLSNDGIDTFATLMMIAVATVLFIACTNLANLMLARSSARAQETAVRAALGASRWRLIREQVLESVVLTLPGGLLGLLLMQGLVNLFSTDLPIAASTVLTFRPEIDSSVLASAGTAMILAVLLAGLWPAWQSTRDDVRGRMGGGLTTTTTKWRLHRNLVAWQVTGSVALFLVAALCATIIGRVRQAPEDASSDRNAVAEIDFARNGRSEQDLRRIVDAIERDVASGAGMSAGASDAYPSGFLLFPAEASIARADAASPSNDRGAWTGVIGATPGFAATGAVHLLRGRWFTPADTAAAPQVAVATESLARLLFQSNDAVGRDVVIRIASRSPGATTQTLTIVGVVRDPAGQMIGRPRTAMLFQPFTQRPQSGEVLLVARGPTAAAALRALRAAIRRADADLAIGLAAPAQRALAGPLYTLRLIAAIASALGALALVLAMAGLYGVLSHVVARRTRELGIRLAIGASPRQVFALVLRDGCFPVLKGLTLGLTIGVGARIAIVARLFTGFNGISPGDPWLVASLPLPFIAAALLACAVPALRAARVDPNVALREL